MLIVSENRDVAEELLALETGAAAFLDGGASCELIAARILHALKLNTVHVNATRKSEKRRILQHDFLELDLDAHTAKWRGQHLEITCREMSLLVALIQHPGVVKSRNSLIDEAYPDNVHVDERTIDSHTKRLRAKFRNQDPSFDGIQSVYGIGYRFRVDHKNAKQITNSTRNTFSPVWSQPRADFEPYAKPACLAN